MLQQTAPATQNLTDTTIKDLSSEFQAVPADIRIQPKKFEQLSSTSIAQWPSAAEDVAETFEPSSDSDHRAPKSEDALSTYFYQISGIPRLTQEEEFGIFIKIEKYRKRIGECYQELMTYPLDIDPETPPSAHALKKKVVADAFTPSTRRYLLELVRHIQLLQVEIHTAKNRVVEANLRLAVCIAKKYQARGLDLSDLIQEANIGLINATDHFDWRRGVKFSANGSWWIQQAIGCGIANRGRTIRLPAYLLDDIRKVNRAKERFHEKGNHAPSLEEIAEATEFSIEKIIELDQFASDATSLEDCISTETGCEVGDFVACEQAVNPLTGLVEQSLIEEVKAAVAELPSREKQIVFLRYGLHDGEGYSLQEIGAILNLSRERVRQLEVRALHRLRHPARSERLREFLVA
jgi:RNA polymerase sigma factor (sigma-70 family)